MSVVRAGHKRGLAFTVALAILFALAIPFAGIAIAHTDNEHNLQITPEVDTNATGTTHTLTATLSAVAPAGGEEIDFEVESGPAARVNCTPSGTAGTETCTSGTSNSDSDRAQPDMTCTIPAGERHCQVFFTADTIGTNLVRGWVDDDKNNATVDADLNEGRDAGESPEAGECADQPSANNAILGNSAGESEPGGSTCNATDAPGDRTEVDDTDVVEKSWFSAAQANIRLDCDDDDNTDTETNAPGASEIYTCFVFNTNGTPAVSGAGDTDDDQPVSGAVIDGENLNGANDLDNASAAPPDYTCTTGADGTCQITVSAAENSTGSATVCFWIDEDNDSDVNTGGPEFDGGECDNEAVTADEYTTPDGNTPANKTDLVTKTWAVPAVDSLDAEPERDSNLKGSQHTVTATTRDQFGSPIANVPVDFLVSGANAALGLACNNVLTNAQGVATCTYTDSTTVVGPEPETDTINVFVDGNAGADTTVDEVDSDLGDQVEKFWFTAFPTANAVTVDMDSGPNNTDCDDDDPDTADNNVETNHEVCGRVVDSNNAPIAGKNVTLTLSGPGNFVNEGNTPGDTGTDRDDDTGLGTSTTVTTNSAGIWRANITSLVSGTTTVTATVDSKTDTGAKGWIALAGAARTIDCEPESADNPPGTTHVIVCTAKDRLGNPDAGELITATETGPGRFDNADVTNVATDANGQFEFIVSTTVNETGTQTVTVALDDDADDTTPLTRDNAEAQDECDKLAGNPDVEGSPASPAGQCADQVTKDWGEEELAECEDDADNDGDGKIDFPNDPGCENAEDDTESPNPPKACQDAGAGKNVIVGTDGADVLTGTSGPDAICGAGGDDVISGKDGNDLIVGNGGDDTIGAGGGKDDAAGNGGNDTVSGGGGNDSVKGNDGNDALKGNAGIDNISGGGGADTLQGGDGDDILKGGDGNDTLRGGDGADALDGGGGSDQCFGNAGNDDLTHCE